MAEAAGKILDFYTETVRSGRRRPSFRIVEVNGANWPSRGRSERVAAVVAVSKGLRSYGSCEDCRASVVPAEDCRERSRRRRVARRWHGRVCQLALLSKRRFRRPKRRSTSIRRSSRRWVMKAIRRFARPAASDKDSPEYRSLVEYKGAFVLRMLQWVIGDDNFQKLLAGVCEEIPEHARFDRGFRKAGSETSPAAT